MALRPEYEAIRASLLNRNPLSSLDTAIQAIIFEETRLNLDKTPQMDAALATTRFSHQKSNHHPCKNCNRTGHIFANCPTIECRYYHGISHILEHCPTRPPKQNRGFTKSKNVPTSGSSSISVVATEGSTTITMSDIEDLIKQVMSSNNSTAMSATHGNSRWFFDSACSNHMTTGIKSLPVATLVSSLPPIHIASGNTINITHTGHVSTLNLTLPDTYYIPNLKLNLISIGQLCEQGLNVYFSPSGVQVHDPQTKQIIGTGRRVGRLFELQSLHLPKDHISATTINSPIHQSHLRLGHASASKIQPLISRGLLGSTKIVLLI
ncbi:unnamed protein product [Vicia faba]|uniref:CCHC-type domain-containing protein n=1 Tax=Vicia faba TaxID=3906 RepID=A0AAV0YSL6_VICFA|nr:unnamed protein product [Vicia faba]